MSNSAHSSYTARHLSVLEGLEAVRKRPGMYIGSTDTRGLMHCLWEIIDNAVDEALEGHGDSINIILHEDNSIEVQDSGRGIPVDQVENLGLSGIEVVFTRLHAGGKFGSGTYAASGGLHGVGASVVNALSVRLDVSVQRGGKSYSMSFRRGEPGVFNDKNGISAESEFTPFTDKSELTVGKAPRGKTGTTVRYWPDPQIFPQAETIDLPGLISRARQTAFLVPGLQISIKDERSVPQNQADVMAEESENVSDAAQDDAPQREHIFKYEGGVSDFVEFLAPDSAVTPVLRLQGTDQYTETVQQLGPDGHLRPQEVQRECEVDIALRWGIGYDTRIQSFVNIIATPKGGTHLAGFEQAVLKSIRGQITAQSRRLKISAKDSKERIEKDDVLAGLTAVVTVRVPEPQFEGQTKEVLGTADIRPIVSRIVERELTEFLTSNARHVRPQATALLEKVVGEMRARIAARTQKEVSRRKNALESSTLPAKLADCRTDDVERSELFIVEGDSALGTAKLARNSEFQALLPIRGKILNVQKASMADMLNNAECAAIIQVIGAGSGRSFDLEAARYGKIILMTDADVDGAHIRTLLLTLFFRYMPDLVKNGRVYAAVPPLHRIETIAQGRSKRDVTYTYSEEEMRRHLAKLERSGRRYKEPIQRYKGLGEMDADQLAETTMDPAHRTLRQITMADEEALYRAESTFALLMGSEVAPRREFIVAGAHMLDSQRIDA